MKKYINKLFEWLGYVPKRRYKELYKLKHDVRQHDTGILNYNSIYQVVELGDKFVVLEYCSAVDNNRYVKAFQKGYTKDSLDYARICAEELCDMLNEKY